MGVLKTILKFILTFIRYNFINKCSWYNIGKIVKVLYQENKKWCIHEQLKLDKSITMDLGWRKNSGDLYMLVWKIKYKLIYNCLSENHMWELLLICCLRIRVNYPYPFWWEILMVILNYFNIQNYHKTLSNSYHFPLFMVNFRILCFKTTLQKIFPPWTLPEQMIKNG